MKISVIKKTDVANGMGIRVSIFVCGCRHTCKGCFNKEIWDFSNGEEFDDNIIEEILEATSKEYISGITLIGGEPLDPINQEGVYRIISLVRKKYPNKNIWCYTGFTYEYLFDIMLPHYPYLEKILNEVDVLVDGRFEIELLDLKLRFRGSKNQRVIDMKKSKKMGKIIWYLDFEEGESKYYIPKNMKTISDGMDRLIRKEISNKFLL